MHPILFTSARFSLCLLWLTTAYASVFGNYNFGVSVLANGGITGGFADLSIYCGAAVDAFIGIWLLTGWKLKECLIVQAIVIITYTGLLTVIDSTFWNHPFGPLTKNIPIIVLIAILFEQNERSAKHKKAPL
jgi:hypothetical protein